MAEEPTAVDNCGQMETPEGECSKARILRAARLVFSSYSFKAASTRMIAREAGVDHPLIHYYFGSKEKLFEHVLEGLYSELYEKTLSWFEEGENLPPREAMSGYLDRLIEYDRNNPEILRITLHNIVQLGNIEELPGYHHVLNYLEKMQNTIMERMPPWTRDLGIGMFVTCFNALAISLLGAKPLNARLINLDPESSEYSQKVKGALLILFMPWIEGLLNSPEK